MTQQFNQQHIQTIHQLIETSLDPQRQQEALQLLTITSQYDNYIEMLLFILTTLNDPKYISMTLILINQGIQERTDVNYSQIIQLLLQLISNGNQLIMKKSYSIISTCFNKSPFIDQIIFQALTQSIQSNNKLFVEFSIDCCDILIDDHIENIKEMEEQQQMIYMQQIQQIVQTEIQMFKVIPLELQINVMNTINNLILSECYFLNSAVCIELLKLFCGIVNENEDYRKNLCLFLMLIPHICFDELNEYLQQIYGIIQQFLMDKNDSVFVEAIETLITFIGEYDETALKFFMNMLPYLYDRAMLNDESIQQIIEEDETIEKEQALIRESDSKETEISCRHSVFGIIENIVASYKQPVLDQLLTTTMNCYQQKQSFIQQQQNNQIQTELTWKNNELFIQLLKSLLSRYDNSNDDVMTKYGNLCIIPIQNVFSDNPFIKRCCLDFICENGYIVKLISNDIQQQLYNHLVHLIGNSNYIFSSMSLNTIRNLIESNVFQEKAIELLQMAVPTIKTLNAQSLLNMCELIATIVSTNPHIFSQNETMYLSLQKEIIQCIYNHRTDEMYIDILLTTLYSNLLSLNSDSPVAKNVDLYNMLLEVLFQLIEGFISSSYDIIVSCLRLLMSLYKLNMQYMIMFYSSHSQQLLKLLSMLLPIDHQDVMLETFYLISDLLSGLPEIIASFLPTIMKYAIKKIKMFKDESIVSTLWFMIQALTIIPQQIQGYIEEFATQTLKFFDNQNISVRKNIYLFAAKVIPLFPQFYVPHLNRLTSYRFREILQIRQKQYIVQILMNFGQLIIAYPTSCQMNKEIIDEIYMKVSSEFVEIQQICLKIKEVLN